MTSEPASYSNFTGYTKHTTHTDALDTLGTIITADEGRDAIHVAVFPAKAAENLRPGDHVGFDTDGNAEWNAPGDDSAIGIVDPFITGKISKGQWFWLLVYPRQITSLRHVWEHPSFPSTGPVKVVVAESVQITVEDPKVASERWLRDWIDGADCPDFFTTIGAMLAQRDGGSWDSDYVHFNNIDAYGSIPTEAWHHLGIFVGEDLSGDRPSYFSCSC